MKLALLSDVHANLQAFQACLVHARAAGASRLALLGDLVDYGGQPAEVVALATQLAREGAIVLRGNHDEAAVRGGEQGHKDAAAVWTHGQLDGPQRAFLAALPLTAVWEDALLVHATADDPQLWHYADHPVRAERSLEAAEALAGLRRVFCGHVHHQRLYYRGRRGALLAFEPSADRAIPVGAHRAWLATVGSVGQPRDGDPRAMYALFDARLGQLVFQRVAYDHPAAAAAVRRAGLPEESALRLERGL
jgi:diadenosine tetraphosphatase ApaH/serine/threonine PP2A family protein phosphatase